MDLWARHFRRFPPGNYGVEVLVAQVLMAITGLDAHEVAPWLDRPPPAGEEDGDDYKHALDAAADAARHGRVLREPGLWDNDEELD